MSVRSTGRRATLLVAALIAVVPFAASGCGGGDPEVRPTGVVTPAKPEPKPLTLDLAWREYRAFVANDDVARAANDERLALAWVSDGESSLTAAEYRRAAFDGDPVKRYDYTEPKLYVPKLGDDVYPQWFVASVQRTERGDPESKRTVLMAFILRAPGERWTLSLRTVLAPKVKEPMIPLDREGYAEALNTADTTVLIRPREVPGIQATVAMEGPDSIAARVMRSGPFTTGYYTKARKDRRRAKAKDLKLTTVITATSYPIFQLRTESGGGLVLYSLYRNSVTGVKDEDDPLAKPPIPPEAEHLLDGTVEGNEIHVSEALQFAAFDPARPTEDDQGDGQTGAEATEPPKAEVIAESGSIVKAEAPPKKEPE